MRILHTLLAFAVFTLPACPAPQTTGARMQEAANDLNTNMRFGRVELAMERVAPAAREEFLQHRRGWGSSVRLADYELVGARLTAESDADVTVRVAWYRPDEQDLRITTVRQRWHDEKGDWMLVGEIRLDGELGLLGEPNPPQAPREPTKHAQFPTVRIGASQ
jgi:hypothetical protein